LVANQISNLKKLLFWKC